jgi:protein dithiol:quinone oxidoreductase
VKNKTMLSEKSTRLIFAAIGAFCVALLVNAYLMQYGPGQTQPCPLCILQRYVYMAIALVALPVAAIGPKRNCAMVAAGVLGLFAAVGAALAIWQVTKGESMATCMSDPVGIFVYNLPMRGWWPEFLAAYGGCADYVPPILGVSVPMWSLVCFSALAIICDLVWLKLFKDAR